MKYLEPRLLLIIAAVAVIGTAVALQAQTGSTQSSTTKSSTKPATSTAESKNAPVAKAQSSFAAAAGRNASLRDELMWTFGGKRQRGWYLYVPLIQSTLNTEREPDSPEFATALATWQKQKGMSSDGVLDEATLMSFVSDWQARRLKDRTPAQVEQLVTPPATEFFDPERLPELRQIERTTYAAYRKMLVAALADPTLRLTYNADGELAATEQYFKVISAFRSREYQEELRRKSPNAGTAGLAINSPHFTGRALDIYVGGDPVDTRDSNRAVQVKTPAYQWLVRNAERFGFRPYFYEPWHWEYVK